MGRGGLEHERGGVKDFRSAVGVGLGRAGRLRRGQSKAYEIQPQQTQTIRHQLVIPHRSVETDSRVRVVILRGGTSIDGLTIQVSYEGKWGKRYCNDS